jgi:hypothetical protein
LPKVVRYVIVEAEVASWASTTPVSKRTFDG